MAVLTYNGNIIGKSSANDGVLTIKRNGTTIQEFSANQSSNAIADISVPTTASDITYSNTTSSLLATNVQSAIDEVYNATTKCATDISSLSITGTTNNTGSTITKNSYLYLNSILIKVTADIANGGTFTIGTNYVTATVSDGIKAACDGVDGISANYIKATQSAAQTLTSTNSARTALILKSGTTTGTFVNFRGSNDAVYGYLGVTSSNKPYFLDASATEHEIALKEEVVKTIELSFTTPAVGQNAVVALPSGITSQNAWVAAVRFTVPGYGVATWGNGGLGDQSARAYLGHDNKMVFNNLNNSDIVGYAAKAVICYK